MPKLTKPVHAPSQVPASPPTAPALPHNRLKESEREERVRKAAQAEADEREATEQEGLDESATESEGEPSLSEMMSEVVVKTKDGLPDMRIKENRQAFLFNPLSKLNGTPDQRKRINRPDLQKLRQLRGTDKPNFIFTSEGKLR